MRTTFIAAEPRLELERDGFAVVPFLGDDDLARVRRLHEELGQAPDDPGIALHFGFYSQDTAWKREVREALRPTIEPLLEPLFDRYTLAWAMFITKWPGERSGFGPHQDPWFVDETRFRSLNLWCPIDDTPAPDGTDNGALHVVPGSHRFSTLPRIHDANTFHFDEATDLILNEYGELVPLRAGQAVVFDNGIIHYSYRNGSDRPRTVLSVGLRPIEAPLFHFRPNGPEAVSVLAIDPDYFVEHNPFSLSFGLADYPVVAEVPYHRERLDLDDFRARCEAARETRGLARTGERPADARTNEELNADPYCFLCGGTEGLEEAPRPQHAAMMMVCTSCAAGLQARYGDAATAEAVADPDADSNAEAPPAETTGGLPEDPAPAEGPPERAAAFSVVRDHGQDRVLAADGVVELGKVLDRAARAALEAGLGAGSSPAPDLQDPALGALLAALDRLLAGREPFAVHTSTGEPAAGGLQQGWSCVDEAAGERSHVVVTAIGTGGATLHVVPGTHLVDGSPRGPGGTAAWLDDDRLAARARTVVLRPGEAAILDQALAHRLEGAVVSISFRRPGAALINLRLLPDGRTARYAVDPSFFEARPPLGQASLPPFCPVDVERLDPPAAVGEVLALLDERPQEPAVRRNRWWPFARSADRASSR